MFNYRKEPNRYNVNAVCAKRARILQWGESQHIPTAKRSERLIQASL